MHQSVRYLQEILRDQWGFDGIIVSDYEGIAQLFVEHKTQPDIAAAAAAALKAGVDVELPGDTAYREGLKQALDRGELDMAVVDQAVLRHLIWKFRLGLFDKPYVDEGSILPDLAKHDELAYRAAVKSIVLLKNDGILPLADAGKVALVGPLADNAYGMLGGYSFPVHLVLSERKERDTALRTLRNELSDRFGENLVYRKGCDILSGRPDKPAVFPGDVAQDGSSQTSYISTDESGFAEALDAARNADTVIMAVGDLAGLFLSGTVGEGSDASSLELPGAQRRLAEAVLDLGKPTIVIMFSGRPYNSGTIFERANAVIQAWLPGQRGAGALADIMTGTVNPEGRLSVSIPHVAGAMPYFYNHKRKSPGTPIQQEFGAAYPFGFGLSYTTFAMDSFAVEKKSIPIDGDIRVSLTVANTGKREGDELVQVYIRDNYSQLVRPVMELKAFQRVTLASGQKAKLSFRIPSDMLQYTGRDGKRMVEGGTFDIMIGNSSRNILFKETVMVEGNVRYLESDWKMLSTCDVSYLN
jgi:beta-glucosidase